MPSRSHRAFEAWLQSLTLGYAAASNARRPLAVWAPVHTKVREPQALQHGRVKGSRAAGGTWAAACRCCCSRMMSCTSACSGEASRPRSATLAAVSSPSEGVRPAGAGGAAEAGAGSIEVRHSSVSAACLRAARQHVTSHAAIPLESLCFCPRSRWSEPLHLY